MSKNWIYSWQSCFSKIHPQFFQLGKLCEDHGCNYHWTSGQKNTSHQKWQENRLQYQTTYHPLSLVYRQVLLHHPHLHSPTSSSQDTVTTTEKWEYECGGTGKPVAWTSRNRKTQIKTMTTKNYRVTSCKVGQIGYRSSGMDWWMKVFQNTETLPFLLMNSLQSREQKVVSGKHSILTHFPKDRNCDICLRTKSTRSFLQKTCWQQSCPDRKLLVI